MAKPVFYLKPTVTAPLQKGLQMLSGWLPFEVRRGQAPRGATGLDLLLTGSGGPEISIGMSVVTLRGSKAIHLYRALGLLAAQIKAGEKPAAIKERADFETLNVMLDVSRNAVMTPEMIKVYLAHFALMGLGQVMLYAESTYRVPGEPYFGYLNGSYTHDELKDLDNHAHDLGIEMVPCIQALAHLARVLQWPVYGKIQDTKTVMMVDEKATEVFVEKMVAAASAPFRSKRIHVGMDEAWDLGLGNYLKKNGYQDPHGMISRHLTRVAAICEKKGLKPMMWSDMFFRAASKTGIYYDLEAVIPPSAVKAIPKNMQQVYWDYYHFDQPFYETFIDKHKSLGGAPLVATGGQTWTRFWAHYEYAFTTLKPCVEACRKKGVKEIIMTLWGDDGAECDWASMLPVLQYYANGAYRNVWDEKTLAHTLSGSCDMNWKAWKAAGELDHFKGFDGPRSSHNTTKVLLWEDPLIGLQQPMVEGLPLVAHYKAIEKALAPAVKGKGRFDEHLEIAYRLARVLSLKADLPSLIRKSYLKKDLKALGAHRVTLQKLHSEVTALAKVHRRLWHDQNNPLGWEVLEVRYGGLLARIGGARERIQDFIGDKLENLAELDEKRLPPQNKVAGRLPTVGYTHVYGGQPMPLNWGPL